MPTWIKDPAARLDYVRDWGSDDLAEAKRWLADDDTIATSTWVITAGPDDALVLDDDSHDDKTATVWIEGGTLGGRYTLTNGITTAGGRTDERDVYVVIRNR